MRHRSIASLTVAASVFLAAWILAAGDARGEQASSQVRALQAGFLDGAGHTCAVLDDGNLRCWGLGNNGRLGYGNTANIGDNETPGAAGPVDLGAGRTARAVATGTAHTCALLDSGEVRCWGSGSNGELGYATTAFGTNSDFGDEAGETPATRAPVDLGAGRTARAITAGNAFTCALLDNGSVRCWGLGSGGRLGYGSSENIGDDESPGSVGPVDLGTGRTAIAISSGSGHTCAILDDGSVRCWGVGNKGQLGYGTTAFGTNSDFGDEPGETPASQGPVNLGPGRSARAISAGGESTCALLDDGDVRCWGEGSSGQLGYGNTDDIGDTETPGSVGPVSLGAGRTGQAISAGSLHTCALLDNGDIRCWGEGGLGQLGYGTITFGTNSKFGDEPGETPDTRAPVDVGAGRSGRAIVAAGNHSCAVLDDGGVRCWGFNGSGHLGYGHMNLIGDNESPGSVGPIALGRFVPGSVGDLSLQVSASPPQRQVGEQVTFTVTLANAGPDSVTADVIAPLPDGVALVSATPSQGEYDAATGHWRLGALASSAIATLQVLATTSGAGTRTLTAEVSGADAPDPDSIVANGAAAEDDRASASVLVTAPASAPATPSPASDTTPPVVTVSARSSLTLARFRRGFSASATPSEPSTLSFELLAKARRASIAATSDMVLAFKLLPRAAGRRAVNLKPKRALLGTPRKSFRVRLRTTATDASGNSRTVVKTIRVKVPRKRR